MSLTPFFKTIFTNPHQWEEYDRSFQQLANLDGGFSPKVDVHETENEIVVHAEIPGVAKEDIKLNFENGCLQISGKRESRSETKDATWHRIETSRGEFSRTIGLPKGIEGKDISATHKDGVIEVTIKKPAPSATTHTIQIN